ncbi:flavin reductase [Azohydromonas lata]|uniref:flavin reductase n=1 Tax=Azohydromonas lata TaxID=45677 RepID=UPI000B10C6B4|nr:flavin reductase [Azohydromonas lata]
MNAVAPVEQPTAPALDPRAFRAALGSFATGVTVITARAADGTPVGLTANSFNSVSLEPPMVLWSLARKSLSLPVFAQAQHWAVHVLAADQEALSTSFARSGTDKFAGLAMEDGLGGVPLLEGCAARFQCRTAFQHEGGDHLIFVGEVLAFDRAERAPLVFHAGRYALAARRDPQLPQARSARVAGGLGEDLLGYLLGRAYFQCHLEMRERAAAAGLDEHQWVIVAALTVRDGVGVAELEAALGYVLDGPVEPVLRSLRAQGWVTATGSDPSSTARYTLTPDGRDRSLHLLAAAKAHEAELLARFGYDEGALLKLQLQKFIAATNPGLPDLWHDA